MLEEVWTTYWTDDLKNHTPSRIRIRVFTGSADTNSLSFYFRKVLMIYGIAENSGKLCLIPCFESQQNSAEFRHILYGSFTYLQHPGTHTVYVFKFCNFFL